MSRAHAWFARAAMATAALLLGPAAVRAGSNVRYALIIGNNEGKDGQVQLDDLVHAERNAAQLRDALLAHGGFDAERVVLVRAGDRDEILRAAERLATLHQRDQRSLGPQPSLFLLFFTGHGLAGRLLTSGAALSGNDLARIFHEMGATLTLAFVDACFAGSMSLERLRAKGVLSTPGFNPIVELPKEVLTSEGMMLFASSSAEELSYEDREFGGLFTHFFAEAFTATETDGFGVTLDSMWEYARHHTQSYAARWGRQQTPQKIVRQLKSSGPLYLSLPASRTARIRFAEPVAGSFLVRSGRGALVEKVEKRAGVMLDVPIYDGEVELQRLDAGSEGARPSQRWQLKPGMMAYVRGEGDLPPPSGLGFRAGELQAKGRVPGLTVSAPRAQLEWALGVGYFGRILDRRVAAAQHGFVLDSTHAYGPFAVGLLGRYGRRSERFEAWGYDLTDLGGQVTFGYGVDWRAIRTDVQLAVGGSWIPLAYRSGAAADRSALYGDVTVRTLLPWPTARPWVLFWARVGGGLGSWPGLARGDDRRHTAVGGTGELGVMLPLLAE